jgi:hypothetical protein
VSILVVMFMLNVHWDLREVWLSCTLTGKFYILCLLVSAIYISYSLVRTALDIRCLPRDRASTDALRVRSRLIDMNRGIENLRQFNTLLFLLFGIFFANEAFATLREIQQQAVSLSGARIDIFVPLTVFAFVVFVILAFLHGFQWIVAARLRSKLASISLREE